MPPRLWAFWCFISLLHGVSVAQNNSCSGTVVVNATKELQFLTTPNFDSNYKYPPLLDCKFFIKAPDKSRIVIDIIEMEMEPRIFDECSDYVAIYEENSEKNSSSTITLCESSRMRQYITSSNNAILTFHSDELIEYRGAKLSYRYYDFSTCPPGWAEISDQNCVRLESEQKTDWIRAQNRCLEQQSNLIMIDSGQKTTELENMFKSVPTRLWIGDTDSQTEGRLMELNDKEAPMIPNRDPTNTLTDNNDDNDCMTLQFGDNQPYRMDSCSSSNGYICEMKKDGTSKLYPPPIQAIQDGAYSRNSQYTVWLLAFLLGLLFLTIFACVCYMCWRPKDARVHTEAATIQQNAFMTDSTNRVEQPRATSSGLNNTAAVSSGSHEAHKTTARSSPVTVPIENNRPSPPKKFPLAPVPNRLPMAEENSDSDQLVETGILRNNGAIESVSGAPEPQPRTIPPMPPREGTFHSITTKGGSTMRTRRNKELFERPIMNVLDNVSAISLDEFWSNKKP